MEAKRCSWSTSPAKMMAAILVALALAVFSSLAFSEKAYADGWPGPSYVNWDNTVANWDPIYDSGYQYHVELYERDGQTETPLLSFDTEYDHRDFASYITEHSLQGHTLFCKVRYFRPGSEGNPSNFTTSGDAVFCNVNLRNPQDSSYSATVLARVGYTIEMPDPPANTPEGTTFGGWSASNTGTPLWNFPRDKVTEDLANNLTLYVVWMSSSLVHEHDGITFQPWIYTDRLPGSGDYYLVDDVYLNVSQAPDGVLNLCLNGKTVYGQAGVRVFDIHEGANVTLYDGEGGGSLQGNTTWQSSYNGGNIKMTGGTFTLNGGQIKNGQSHDYGGNVYIEDGTFTMNGGSITGGHAGAGATGRGNGVYVCGGTFTMNGGTISGNGGGDSFGGGVAVYDSGHFHMAGGTIASNSARIGGGVFAKNGSMFSISGGTITQNSGAFGAGVSLENGLATIKAGSEEGKTDVITIKGNSETDLYKGDGTWQAGYPIVTVEAAIKEGSEIGVCGDYLPRQGNAGKRLAVTMGLATSGNDDASAFFSSDDGCTIIFDGGEAKLVRYWKIEYKAGNHGSGDMSDKATRIVDEASYEVEENAFTPEQYYEFAGWKAGNSVFDEKEEIEKVEQDLTFTAQWKATKYTIEYDLAGGSLPAGVTNPEAFTGLTATFTFNNPERVGYTFAGWTGTGLDEPTPEVTIAQGTTENKQFSATWTPITYTISYRLNGGQLPTGKSNPIEYTIETPTFTLVNPARSSYNFVGWVGTELDGETQEVTIEQGSMGDKSYVAVFEGKCPDGHTWVNGGVVTQPTCTEEGARIRTCSVCGEVDLIPIAPTGHKHEYTGFQWYGNDETGYYDAFALYTCKHGCGSVIRRGEQDCITVVEKEATCLEEGTITYTASISSRWSFDYMPHKESKVVKKSDALGHDYQEVDGSAVAPTCEAPGKEADQKCTRCDDVIVGAAVPALGHEWGEWKVVKEPTELVAGEEQRVCAHDPSHVDSRVIPVKGHEHVLSKVEAADPTCTAAGNTLYWVCDQGENPCGRFFADAEGKNEIDREDTVVAATGHTQFEMVHENEVPATCENGGAYDVVVYCADCGTEMLRSSESIPALGHTLAKVEAVPATCEEGGTEAYWKCSECGKLFSDATGNDVISQPVATQALGHAWGEWTVVKKPTATETGLKERVCGNDPSHVEQQTIPATGGDEFVTWTRLAGEGAFKTMAAIIEAGGFEAGGTVVLASLEGYWDALTAAGVAGLEQAPVVMALPDGLSAEASAQLAKLAPKKIVVCGGGYWLPDALLAEAAAAAGTSPEVVRLAGDNAAQTAGQVAAYGKGRWSDTAIVATAGTFQDALAAAPVSYAKGMPIFLAQFDFATEAGYITADTVKAMQDAGVTQAYIVGGTYWLPKSVSDDLEKAGIKVLGQLGGASAVETSGLVAELACGTLGMHVDNMGVANVAQHYDALASAAFCGKNNSVLVLVSDTNRSVVDSFVAKNASKIFTGYIFGGTGSVSDASKAALEAATK